MVVATNYSYLFVGVMKNLVPYFGNQGKKNTKFTDFDFKKLNLTFFVRWVTVKKPSASFWSLSDF